MPSEWTDKEDRQYEHIRDQYIDDGVSKSEAEERAARTINARREAGGRTDESSDDAPTKDELYSQAKKAGIEGRSEMDKEELENALAGHKGGSNS